MNSVSENLKRIRKQKNLTQQQMADILFVTQQTVSNWEKGKNMPTVDMLGDIAEKLDVEIDELLYESDKINQKRKLKIYGILAVIFLRVHFEMQFMGYSSNNTINITTMDLIFTYCVEPIRKFFIWAACIQSLKVSGRIDRKNYIFINNSKILKACILCLFAALSFPGLAYLKMAETFKILEIHHFLATTDAVWVFSILGALYAMIEEKQQ